MALTHVLQPITLAGTTIRNRVVRTAHGTRLARYSFEDLTAFHAARARGGCGMTILEILGVHPTTPASLNVFDPAHIEGYPRMMDALRPLGMKVLQQLWHGGHHVPPMDGSPPWSASDIPSPAVGQVPIPMTKAMIDEIVQAYATAARRCREWGLDGVEVHCAHGYLPQQFLSANSNKRRDDYGGSFENRARFALEVIAAIRAEIGRDFILGMRVAPDDAAHGVGVDENIRLVELVESRNLVDYVSVSLGSYQSFHKMIGPMSEPAGYELPTSVPIARRCKSPTIVIGRFRTLEEADSIIRAGDASMVGMSRAHIADPDLVRKTIEGHPERVRPCIGCNQGCLAGVLGPSIRLGCTVNPAVSYERFIGDDKLAPAATPRQVLVVGGGPAGMEAARIAALRGHRVTLAEAQPHLGGTLNIAAKAPSRAGIRDIAVWLEQEIYRLGVDVRLNTYWDAEDVAAFGADAVIVATGATPRMDGLQVTNPGENIRGVDQPHVLSANALFTETTRDLGKFAVVVDDVGHYEGIAATEYLLARGLTVTYVSRQISFGQLLETAATPEPALQRITSERFAMHLRYRALGIGRDDVVVAPTYLASDTNHRKVLPADTVVVVGYNRPNREIYDVLFARGVDVRVVGDANAPRYLPTAMREANAAGAAV